MWFHFSKMFQNIETENSEEPALHYSGKLIIQAPTQSAFQEPLFLLPVPPTFPPQRKRVTHREEKREGLTEEIQEFSLPVIWEIIGLLAQEGKSRFW